MFGTVETFQGCSQRSRPSSTVRPTTRSAVTARIWRWPASSTAIGDVYDCTSSRLCQTTSPVSRSYATTDHPSGPPGCTTTRSSTTSGAPCHRPLEILDVTVRQHVTVPVRLARVRVQRPEVPGRAKRVDPSVVPSRRGARSGAAHRLAEAGRPLVCPELAPRGGVVRCDHFLVATLLDRERAAVGDHERGISTADRLAPQRRQPRRRPIGADCCLEVTTITFRTAKVGPIGPVGGDRRRHGKQPRVVPRPVVLELVVVGTRFSEGGTWDATRYQPVPREDRMPSRARQRRRRRASAGRRGRTAACGAVWVVPSSCPKSCLGYHEQDRTLLRAASCGTSTGCPRSARFG